MIYIYHNIYIYCEIAMSMHMSLALTSFMLDRLKWSLKEPAWWVGRGTFVCWWEKPLCD